MSEKKTVAKRRPATKTKKTRLRKTSVVRPSLKTETPIAKRPPSPRTQRSYIFAVGRRKSAIARVRFTEHGTGSFQINGQDGNAYFSTLAFQKIIHQPIETTNVTKYDISVKVQGGGKRGQADAVRLGVSRAIVKLHPDLRTTLKRQGLLTRDPRVKERKKYGLKRARRAPQWQKR